MQKKYLKLLEDMKAKNFTEERIKEVIAERIDKEVENMQFNFSGMKSEGEGEERVVKIKGYASTKDVDRYGDIVEPKAFKKTMKAYMKNPVLLLQHKHDKPIGSVVDYKIDDEGLFIEGEVKHNDDGVQDKIESKTIKGFSIGFRIRAYRWEEVRNDAGELIDLLFIIEELELLEISVVAVPANPYTLMKSLQGLKAKSIEAALKEMEDEEDDDQDDEEGGENANENDDPNENDNDGGTEEVESEEEDEEEEEKKIEGIHTKDVDEEEVEEDVDTGEVDDTEEIEEQEEEEESEEKEEEDEQENIDDEEKDDTVDSEEEDETDISENPTEEEDTPEGGDTEEPTDPKAFTTNLIKTLVESEVSKVKEANKKEFDKAVKQLKEDFKKEMEKEVQEMYKSLQEVIKGFDQVNWHNEALIKALKQFKGAKGFITLPTFKEKEQGENRIKSILDSLGENRK